MHHLKGQLDQLQQEIDQSDQEIGQGMQNLQNTQQQVSDASHRKAALKRLRDDILSAQAATNKGRQNAQKEASDAQALYDGLFKKLDGQLTDQQRGAIKDAVKKVDDEIDGLQGQADKLRGPSDKAAQAAMQAAATADAKETAYQTALKALQNLPADIQAAQANVARLRGGLRSAADNQKMLEAYYMAGELQTALDGLNELLKPENESSLVDGLVKASDELRSAQADAAGKQAAAQDAQAALAAKEQELQRKTRARPEAIKAAIAALAAKNSAQPAQAAQPVNP